MPPGRRTPKKKPQKENQPPPLPNVPTPTGPSGVPVYKPGNPQPPPPKRYQLEEDCDD